MADDFSATDKFKVNEWFSSFTSKVDVYFIKVWLLSELVTQELLWQLKTSKSAPSFSRLHILFEEPWNLNLGTSKRFF